MKDKHMSAKRKKSNWSNKRSKNSSNRFIPKQVDRVDKELIQEVSVLLSINKDISDKDICKLYKITDIQLDYIKDHQQKWDIVDKITGKEVK